MKQCLLSIALLSCSLDAIACGQPQESVQIEMAKAEEAEALALVRGRVEEADEVFIGRLVEIHRSERVTLDADGNERKLAVFHLRLEPLRALLTGRLCI